MDAIISGRAGVAVLLDGEALSSFDVDDPETLLPRRPADLRLLFGEAPDVQFIEGVDHRLAAQHLERAFNCASALDLALILLDPELTADLRAEAADELEELLADPPVTAYLENVLYARPLPTAADLPGALKLCDAGRTPRLSSLLQILEGFQPAVRAVCRAWDDLPAELFDGSDHKAEFQHAAMREGVFRQLALDSNNPARVGRLHLSLLLNRSLAPLKNSREVLQQWLNPFRAPSATPRVRHEEDDFSDEPSPTRPGRHGRRKRGNAEQELRKLQGQLDLIVEAMHRRDFALARKLTDEVIDYQLKNAKPIHAAKTLCNLATEAKALGNRPLQLELAERATDIVHDDGWSWAQYADALLKLQRPAEALTAYEQAASFGAGVVAKNGRAETLRALNRLPEALAAYDAAVTQHPEDVVAKTGRAETLRAMGRLKDALAAYDAVLANNPNDLVARNGRGGVFMALGLYDKALESLPRGNPVLPPDWIGYHIRGMILLRLGKVDEALRIFEHGAKENPIPSSREYFRSALAVACLRQRDLARAERALEDISTPLLQPQANVLRLHVFGASGKEPDAAAAYEKLRDKPWFIPDELVAELHRRYLLKEEPRHDDDWVYEQELDTFLFDPTQQILSYESLVA
jgi:tetratricopeptide (TPR) repeat protein